MCGIFAYRGSDNASEIVFRGLQNLQYRGYDSWGMAMLTDKGLVIKKNIGALPNIPSLPSSSVAMGHTRWATHGGVTVANSHPHLSCDHRFVVIHNGIVENFKEIKSKLSDNHKFTSATDTELIVHYLEEKEKISGVEKALVKLTKTIKGHSAFVVLDTVTENLYAYRSGSPLVMGKKGVNLFVSSDLPTLSPQVDHIYPLQEGELIDLSKDMLSLKWISSPRVKVEKSKLTTRYHMESEMYETTEILESIMSSKTDEFAGLEKMLSPKHKIILTGCGSSYHACLFGQYLFGQIGISVRTVIASEGDSVIPIIDRDTTIIVLSQSGETIDSIDFVSRAKKLEAHIIALTNVKHSSLDRIADTKLDLGVGIEVAVASTKAFVFMQMFFARLVSYLSHRNISDDMSSYHKNLVKLYGEPSKIQMKAVATELVPLKNLFVISHGDLISLGYEAALKFKEIGYLHAENIVSGELKHGPLALINKHSVCLTINRSNSHDLDHTVSEILARGGKVIQITLPDLGILTSLYGANQMHLISFYHSVLMGNNPDRPRNLAKSVTVK